MNDELQVKPELNLYPPRPATSIPYENLDWYKQQTTSTINTTGNPSWIAQLKYNDTHILVRIIDGKIDIRNRQRNTIKYRLPEHLHQNLLHLASKISPHGWCLLDGGLLHNKHAALKDTIVLWDALITNSTYHVWTTYQERYENLLIALDPNDFYRAPNTGMDLGNCRDNIIIPKLILADQWDQAWHRITELNEHYENPLIEGFVLKNLHGKLEWGIKEENNTGWQIRCRVKTGRHRF